MAARNKYCAYGAGLLLGLLFAATASANSSGDTIEVFGLLGDVSEQELEGTRGRQDIFNAQISEISETAHLDHTAVNSNMTGSNMISDSALSGLNGFSTVIQNTGNNVIIQDSLILNVSVR